MQDGGRVRKNSNNRKIKKERGYRKEINADKGLKRTKKTLLADLLGKIKKNLYPFLLFLICTVLLISHTLYIRETRQYPEQDEHVYLSYAVEFYDIFKNPSNNILSDINQVNPSRQPFYGLILAIPLVIFGTSFTYKLVLWLNIIWYLLTIVGIYSLGKNFLSKKSSLLAAYIFAFYGFPLFYLHFTYSETFVTCLVVLSLLFLAKTNNFMSKKYVILFSIFFTLGNLSRWVVPIFVGGPLLYTLVFSLVDQYKNKKIKKWLVNVGIFIGLGILPILLLYYIPNFSYFKGYVSGNVDNSAAWIKDFFGPEFQGLQNRFSPQSIIFYFNIIGQQTIFFLLLFICGFIFGIFHIKKYAFLISAFIFAYIIFTFGAILKFDRYIVPIYPSVALISAIVFDKIKNKVFLTILITLTITLSFLNFLGGSWGVGPMKFSITGNNDTVPHSVLLPMPIGHPRRVWFAPISWKPTKNELNAEEIFSLIENDSKNKQNDTFVISAFAFHPFENAWHKIEAYERRDKVHILTMRSWDRKLLEQYIKTADYILIKDKKYLDKEYNDPQIKELYLMSEIIRDFNLTYKTYGLPDAFILMKKMYIPLDNTNILIYKKAKKLSQPELNIFLNRIEGLNETNTKYE